MLSAIDTSHLTQRQTLSHAELDTRERETGFAATLEERARADQQAQPTTGPQWWLDQLMQPVRTMQPPATDYMLAKAENIARRQLNMAPNTDTLFTQYFVEALASITQNQREPTAEDIEQAMELAKKAVEQEMEQWQKQLQQRQDADMAQQQLNQIESMQARLREALLEETDTTINLNLMGDTQVLFNQLQHASQSQPPSLGDDANEQIRTIFQARQETAALNTAATDTTK